MRKITILFLLIMFVMSASLVSATPAAELNSLARFYTPDNAFLVSLRTDDAYIDSLDALLQRVLRFLPEEAQMSVTVRDLLNQTLADEGMGTFDEAIRPWLGDTLSIGVILTEASMMENEIPQVLIAVEVDGAAARVFFDQLAEEPVARGSMLITEADGMKMYMSAEDDMYMGITADTLFVSSTKAGLPVAGVESPLSADPIFTEIIGLLPASEYHISMFINTPVLQNLVLAAAEEEAGQPMPGFLQEMMSINGAQALGFTVLGESTLTMDIVQKVDTSTFTDLGVEMYIPGELDPAFVNRIPAGTPLALAIADFGPMLQSGYANLRVLADTIDAQGGLIPLLEEAQIPLSQSDYQTLQAFDPAMLLGMVNASFASATGLSLELDFLPAFDGDAAMYLRTVPVQDFMLPIAPELGFIAEASDSQRALAVVDALTNAATEFQLPTTTEDFGDGRALVIPSTEETTGMVYPGLDLLFGAGNGVIALGTRGAAQSALTADGGLADDPAYQAASAHFLPDTQVMLFLNSAPIFDTVDTLIESGMIPLDRDVREAYPLLSIFESAFISSTSRADGTSMVRMAITLAEQPRTLPEAASTSLNQMPVDRYANIPQSRTDDGAFVLGNPDARVTVVAFEDFLCPHCQNYQPDLKAFIDQHVATGQAKLEFRMVPVVDQTYSPLAFQLAECSDLLLPNSFWMAHDLMFTLASASRFDDGTVGEFAAVMGLDNDLLLNCAAGATQWQTDSIIAREFGVQGTPTVMWRLDGGELRTDEISSRPSAADLSALVAQYAGNQ